MMLYTMRTGKIHGWNLTATFILCHPPQPPQLHSIPILIMLLSCNSEWRREIIYMKHTYILKLILQSQSWAIQNLYPMEKNFWRRLEW